MRRRDALKLGLGAGAAATAAAAAVGATFPLGSFGGRHGLNRTPIARMSITPIELELARGVKVRTIAFDGSVPGPQLDGSMGRAPALDLRNDSEGAVVVHSSAFAETLIMAPGSGAQPLLRAPRPAASGPVLKSYRATCGASGSTASGIVMFGNARGNERGGAGAFDQLQLMSIHRWQGYDYASFNDKLLSASEPIKVRYGERVHFHFANTSHVRGVTLGLPQHRFLVTALDGHDVPTPRHVERLYLGPSESVDALVTMDRPGRWILGSTNREDRLAGLGRLVEYAGATGQPREGDFGMADWDYSEFGFTGAKASGDIARAAHAVVLLSPLRIVRRDDPGGSQVCDPTSHAVSVRVCAGQRHRLVATNFTRDPQSLHLHGHDVELVRVAGQRTAGVFKDVVTCPSFTRVEFEFEARSNLVVLAHNRQVSLQG